MFDQLNCLCQVDGEIISRRNWAIGGGREAEMWTGIYPTVEKQKTIRERAINLVLE